MMFSPLNTAFFQSCEFLLDRQPHHFVISTPDSALLAYMQQNFDPSHILIPKYKDDQFSKEGSKNETAAFEALIAHSNMTLLLHQKKIRCIFLDFHSSHLIEQWAEQEQFVLLSPRWRFQETFENKVFFDTFLQKHHIPAPKSCIIRSQQDVAQFHHFPAVFQIPESTGSEGTFFVKNVSQIESLLAFLQQPYPFLVREFISGGIPLGVTMIIGEKNLLVSSVRVQAYFIVQGASIYYGVQWLPSHTLTAKFRKKLEDVLQTMGHIFQKTGYRGIVNFDFLQKGEDLFFLECNPRSSAATPHLVARKELLHDQDLLTVLTQVATQGDIPVHKPYLPETEYAGFCLNFEFLWKKFTNPEISVLPPGCYHMTNTKVQLDPYKSFFGGQQDSVFLYHILPQVKQWKAPAHSDKIPFVGFWFFHRPLMTITKNNYHFSTQGKKIIENITDVLIHQAGQ